MATYGAAANALITCPYDDTHRVKQSRYQLHVANCEKQHRELKKEICPFNAQHRCDRGTLQHHLLHCPDRAPLDKRLVASNEDDEAFQGHTGVPSYGPPNCRTLDDWDTELTANPRPGYEPRIEPPVGGIRTNFAGMQPAERRSYYRDLHHRTLGDEESGDTSEKQPSSLFELRKPTTVSQAQLLDQKKPIHELQNVGLGRGQPVASATSRIAANIFGDQVVPMRQPRSTSNIPGYKTPCLGMGRGGNPLNDAQVGTVAAAREVVVNPVGLGRGVEM